MLVDFVSVAVRVVVYAAWYAILAGLLVFSVGILLLILNMLASLYFGSRLGLPAPCDVRGCTHEGEDSACGGTGRSPSIPNTAGGGGGRWRLARYVSPPVCPIRPFKFTEDPNWREDTFGLGSKRAIDILGGISPAAITATTAAAAAAKSAAALDTKRQRSRKMIIPQMPVLDANIQTALSLIMRDLVASWYSVLAPGDSHFIATIEITIGDVLRNLVTRAQRVDLPNLIVRNIVPVVTAHIRQFRRAEAAAKEMLEARGRSGSYTDEEVDALLEDFYTRDTPLHRAARRPSRPLAAGENPDNAAAADFLRAVTDKILPLMFPDASTPGGNVMNSGCARLLVREIVGSAVLLNVMGALSDPDFLNKTIDTQLARLIEEQDMVQKLRAALDTQSAAVLDADYIASDIATLRRALSTRVETALKSSSAEDVSAARDAVVALIRRKRVLVVGKAPNDTVNGERVGDIAQFVRELFRARQQLEKHLLDLGGNSSGNDLNRGRISTIYVPSSNSASLGNANSMAPRVVSGQSISAGRYHQLPQRQASFSMAEDSTSFDGGSVLLRQTPVGSRLTPVTASTAAPATATASGGQVISLTRQFTLHEILLNSSSLEYFTEFMDLTGRVFSLQFWLAMEGIRRSPETMVGRNICSIVQSILTTYFLRGRLDELDLRPDTLAGIRGAADIDSSSSAVSGDAAGTLLGSSPENREALRPELDEHVALIVYELLLRAQSEIFVSMETIDFPRFLKSALYVRFLNEYVASTNEQRQQNIFNNLDTQPQQHLPSAAQRKTHDRLASSGSMRTAVSDLASSSGIGGTASILLEGDEDAASLAEVENSMILEDNNNLIQYGEIRAAEEALSQIARPSDTSRGNLGLPLSVSGGLMANLGAVATNIAGLSREIERMRHQETVLGAVVVNAELHGHSKELRIAQSLRQRIHREIRVLMAQRAQYEMQMPSNVLGPEHTRIAIPSTASAYDENGRQFTQYAIEVNQLSRDNMISSSLDAGNNHGSRIVESGWIIARRYSEFYHLHQRLRKQYPGVMRNIELPSKALVLMMVQQRTQIETRRVLLERYLQQIIKYQQICGSVELRAFLSPTGPFGPDNELLPPPSSSSSSSAAAGKGTRSSIGGTAAIKEILDSIYNSIVSSTDESKGGPSMLDIVTEQLARSMGGGGGGGSGSGRGSTSVPSGSADVDISLLDSAGISTPFGEVLCDLVIEMFELKERNNWLRRQAISILLRHIFGGTIERKIKDVVHERLAESELLNHIQNFLNIFWPPAADANASKNDGSGNNKDDLDKYGKFNPPPPRTDQQKSESQQGAREKLLFYVPKTLGSVVGHKNARRGAGHYKCTLVVFAKRAGYPMVVAEVVVVVVVDGANRDACMHIQYRPLRLEQSPV
ncbi:hypothetical protein GQ42DRAFT_178375 [Ramicandelaber brevisporus]|nr:hypothetical protein GQ42DRAFT_178375 [Ramicandelaber brevisporus]